MTVISGKFTEFRPFEGEYDLTTSKGTITMSANSTVLMNFLYDAMHDRKTIIITTEDNPQ